MLLPVERTKKKGKNVVHCEFSHTKSIERLQGQQREPTKPGLFRSEPYFQAHATVRIQAMNSSNQSSIVLGTRGPAGPMDSKRAHARRLPSEVYLMMSSPSRRCRGSKGRTKENQAHDVPTDRQKAVSGQTCKQRHHCCSRFLRAPLETTSKNANDP